MLTLSLFPPHTLTYYPSRHDVIVQTILPPNQPSIAMDTLRHIVLFCTLTASIARRSVDFNTITRAFTSQAYSSLGIHAHRCVLCKSPLNKGSKRMENHVERALGGIYIYDNLFYCTATTSTCDETNIFNFGHHSLTANVEHSRNSR